jgi:4-diphosphocytidyl-2-C-methyl-D-erythritol kinase
MTSQTTPRVEVRAPAKINLTLRVLGTRPDGYHELRTMLQSIALHDTLIFTPDDGRLSIDTDDPRCPANEDNLVWRAADALWRAAGRRGGPEGVRVSIRKQIPLEAGLGGGSSDAAAALRALQMFWKLQLADQQVSRIARDLGADVPFFLLGGTALCVDRGDVMYPFADRPPVSVVLAVPDFGVSTRDAYRWWDEWSDSRGPDEGGNDLQAPVGARHPAIGRAVARLRRLGADHAAMSGSGSVVFGLFESERKARAAARALATRRLRVIVTETLSRRRFRTFSRVRERTSARASTELHPARGF